MSFAKLTDYISTVNSALADNTTREISEKDVRDRFLEVGGSFFHAASGLPYSEYDNGTTYATGDLVSYNNSTYLNIDGPTAGVLPTDATKWENLGGDAFATQNIHGLIRLASVAETNAGTNQVKAVTPYTLDQKLNDAGISSFSQGFVPFGDSDGTLAEDSRLVFNASTARLGVHSSTPTSNLEVANLTANASIFSSIANSGKKLHEMLDTGAFAVFNKGGVSSPSDGFAMYSSDYGGDAGKASPFFRTEDSVVINLRQAWLDSLGNISVNNGLSYDAELSLGWGGTLTGDTSIDGAYAVTFDAVASFNVIGTTSGTRIGTASSPATDADTFSQYALDYSGAGTASPYFLTEDGTTINVRRIWDDSLGNISVNNGLTFSSGTSLGWGGTLTGDTSVDGTYAITFDGVESFNVTGTTSGSRIGTASSPATTIDTFSQYAADYSGAGTASPYFLTEDGTTIGLRKIWDFTNQGDLTQNSVPFVDANGFLAEDTANFLWDNTNKTFSLGGSAFGDGTKNLLVSVGTAPSSGVSDAASKYVIDFDGAGTASPYYLTEDGYTINIRESSFIVKEFELHPDGIPDGITTMKYGQDVEALVYDDSVTSPFTSVSLSARRNTDVYSDPETDWVVFADIDELNTWINGTAVGGVTLASGEYFQFRVNVAFDTNWKVRSHVTIKHRP